MHQIITVRLVASPSSLLHPSIATAPLSAPLFLDRSSNRLHPRRRRQRLRPSHAVVQPPPDFPPNTAAAPTSHPPCLPPQATPCPPTLAILASAPCPSPSPKSSRRRHSSAMPCALPARHHHVGAIPGRLASAPLQEASRPSSARGPHAPTCALLARHSRIGVPLQRPSPPTPSAPACRTLTLPRWSSVRPSPSRDCRVMAEHPAPETKIASAIACLHPHFMIVLPLQRHLRRSHRQRPTVRRSNRRSKLALSPAKSPKLPVVITQFDAVKENSLSPKRS
jgi:hypothetical protein